MARLDNAGHLSALDREIWGDEAPSGPAPDPGAEVMTMMRELVGVMGEMTRMLIERMDKLEARLAPQEINEPEPDERPPAGQS